MKKEAQIISDIIYNTETEERGELFLLIGKNLNQKEQYYTGSLFLGIAEEYGYPLQNKVEK